MTWFRVWNDTRLPLNVSISWGGIIQHYKNEIPPNGGYWEVDVPGGGWHAMTGVVSNGENHFDPTKDNVAAISQWIIGGASLVTAIVGLVLIPLTGGLSSPLLAFAAANTIAGSVVVASDIVIAGVTASLYPASVSNLYGPDGYNVHFTGAEIIGQYDEKTKTFTVEQTRQLSLEWHNNHTGSHGVETAKR